MDRIGTQEKFSEATVQPQHFLDITQELCPITFVRAKLLFENMAGGEIAEIRLNSGEPLANVPRSLKDHDAEILALAPEDDSRPDGVYRLHFRKKLGC